MTSSLPEITINNLLPERPEGEPHNSLLLHTADPEVMRSAEHLVTQLNAYLHEKYKINLDFMQAFENTGDGAAAHTEAGRRALEDTFIVRSSLNQGTRLLSSSDLQDQKRGAAILRDAAELNKTDSSINIGNSIAALNYNLKKHTASPVQAVFDDAARILERDLMEDLWLAQITRLEEQTAKDRKQEIQSLKDYRERERLYNDDINKARREMPAQLRDTWLALREAYQNARTTEMFVELGAKEQLRQSSRDPANKASMFVESGAKEQLRQSSRDPANKASDFSPRLREILFERQDKSFQERTAHREKSREAQSRSLSSKDMSYDRGR